MNGEQVEAVFVRPAEKHDGIDLAEVPGGDVSLIGWVQRVDSEDIEGYLLEDISSKPDADVRIAIGRATEVMHEERRSATVAFADQLRTATGLNVDLEITEYQPGRRGLGPIEWTAIFIGTNVATNLISDLTSDLYNRAKKMLLDRNAKGGRSNKGFVIYGPDGEVLRRWDTKNGDDPTVDGEQ